MQKQEFLTLLHQSVVPALGCTEPVCVAVAVADAARAVGGEIEHIDLQMSQNIYKNGVSVGIAGFDCVGLDYAAALGAVIQAPELGLEIMKAIDPSIASKAVAMVQAGRVSMAVNEKSGIYVRAVVKTDRGEAESVIEGGHTRIVLTRCNGETLRSVEETLQGKDASLVEKLKTLTVGEILDGVLAIDASELEFLYDGVVMNGALADYGVEKKPGIGIAGVLHEDAQKLLGSGLMQRVMARVASATEARLEGCPMATMSSAGSGSKGIAVIIPILEVAREAQASPERLLQALAFGHLLNEYVNAHVGKLSAVCACSMASATAAAASMTWLLGGDKEQITYAIRNMTGSITGVICDGGKVGCALKLSMAMGAAFLSTTLAINHVGLRVSDGICGETAEDNIRHMGEISLHGMRAVDGEILRIMTGKFN